MVVPQGRLWGPNSFIFMQFTVKNLQKKKTVGKLGVGAAPEENPVSATT